MRSRTAAPVADRLEITATNLSAVTIDARRAGVTCDAEVVIDSDTPLEVTFTGCGDGGPVGWPGPTRIDTAVAVSRDGFADGAAGAVVLARADEFIDALAGGPLAVAVDGPLLLSWADHVPAATMAELDRVLGAGGTVHVLGGDAALSSTIDDQLAAAGYQVVRHAGADRFETSVRIAEAIGGTFGGRGRAVGAGPGRRGVVRRRHRRRAAGRVAGWGAAAQRRGAPAAPQVEALTGAEGATGRHGGRGGVRGPAAGWRVLRRAGHRHRRRGTSPRWPSPSATPGRDRPRRRRRRRASPAAPCWVGRPAGPVLLVQPDGVPADVRRYLSANAGRLDAVLILGGEAAVDPSVVTELQSLLTPDD